MAELTIVTNGIPVCNDTLPPLKQVSMSYNKQVTVYVGISSRGKGKLHSFQYYVVFFQISTVKFYNPRQTATSQYVHVERIKINILRMYWIGECGVLHPSTDG